MRLVGTLEDEEDLCIKKRRQEEKKVQEVKVEDESVADSGGGIGSEGGQVSTSDKKGDSTFVNAPASQSPERGRKPSAEVEEGAGGALAGKDGTLAMLDAEQEGSDVMASDNVTGRPAPPDGLPVAKSSSVLGQASDDKQATLDSSDGAVTTADPLCGRGDAELSTTSGETRARDSAGKGHTADGKSSGDAAAESAEAVVAIAVDEDEEEVTVEADHPPLGCSSAKATDTAKNESQRCSGGGGGGSCGVNADADTSTDDGETTDAGDHDDDDDDDEVDGAAVRFTPPPPPDSSAEPVGTGLAAVVTQKEEKDDRQDIAAVAPAVPQLAAVTEVFGGTMCSVVTCSSCGGRSFCTEPTICLSLEIPMKPRSPSETALAFIAKKKAAAAAKAAAANAETEDSEPGTTTADGTCTADGQPSPASGDVADQSVTGAALGEETAGEVEGFQLSAKEKRKVRQSEVLCLDSR